MSHVLRFSRFFFRLRCGDRGNSRGVRRNITQPGNSEVSANDSAIYLNRASLIGKSGKFSIKNSNHFLFLLQTTSLFISFLQITIHFLCEKKKKIFLFMRNKFPDLIIIQVDIQEILINTNCT